VAVPQILRSANFPGIPEGRAPGDHSALVEREREDLVIALAAHTGYVAIWYDQSGHGYHLSQPSNTSLQPQTVYNGSVLRLSGKPSVSFTGGQWMSNANVITSGSAAASINAVASTAGSGMDLYGWGQNLNSTTGDRAALFSYNSGGPNVQDHLIENVIKSRS
jgi:hypothetical protein